MFYLIYFLAALLFLLIGLFAVMLRVNPYGRWRNPRQRLWRYVGGAALIVVLGAALFTALASMAGLMTFGAAQVARFPADFLAAGGSGIGLLVLAGLLAISPLALAARMQKPDKNMDKFGAKRAYVPAAPKKKKK
jgi:hypothetical protein